MGWEVTTPSRQFICVFSFLVKYAFPTFHFPAVHFGHFIFRELHHSLVLFLVPTPHKEVKDSHSLVCSLTYLSTLHHFIFHFLCFFLHHSCSRRFHSPVCSFTYLPSSRPSRCPHIVIIYRFYRFVLFPKTFFFSILPELH